MVAEEAEVVCVDQGVKRPCVLCSWKAPATTQQRHTHATPPGGYRGVGWPGAAAVAEKCPSTPSGSCNYMTTAVRCAGNAGLQHPDSLTIRS